MKVGSLVVIKKLPTLYLLSDWLPNDNESDIYTIRAIGKDQFDEDDMVVLEEGCMGHRGGAEIGIEIKYVREVQPPEEVDIEEIVEEAMCVPIEK